MTLVVLPEADEIITVNLLPTWHGTQKKLRRKNYKKVAVAATRRRHLANISWHNLDHSQRLITGNQEKTTSLLSLHYKLPGHIKTSVPCFSMLFSFSFSAFSLPWLGGNKALYIFREPYHAGKQKHLVWAKKKKCPLLPPPLPPPLSTATWLSGSGLFYQIPLLQFYSLGHIIAIASFSLSLVVSQNYI